MVARAEGGRHLGPGPAGPHRHAVAQGLGHGHHVGRQALGLEGEPVAGAPETGLHLIEHQERVALGAQRPHGPQVVRARHVDPPFALEGLEQHGGRWPVRGRCPARPRRRRGRARSLRAGVGTARASRAARWRPAWPGSARGTNRLGADHEVAAPAGPAPGQLQRALVGLGARVGEEHLTAGLARPTVDQPVDGQGHLRRQLVAVEVGHVAQRPGLRSHGLGHHRMRVPEGHHGQAGDEIEVLGSRRRRRASCRRRGRR